MKTLLAHILLYIIRPGHIKPRILLTVHHGEVVYVDKIYVDEVYQEWTNYTTNVLPFISPTFSMHFNLIKLDSKKNQD